MKKTIKVVSCMFCLSLMLHLTGISAATVTNLVNFKVSAWSGGTYVGSMNKTVDGRQKLNISSYFARDLSARIVASNSSNHNGDSGYYWILSMNEGFNTRYLGNDMNAANSAYAYFVGTKKLYLKTTGYWYDTTSVSGQWYING